MVVTTVRSIPVLLISVCISALACAQESTPTQEASQPTLTEVIVTAQKRSQNLQDVPIEVSSISAQDVESANIKTTYDLASVSPGLTSYQATGFFMPHLRGIGNTVDSVGIENPVAVYVDGVYYASMSGSLLSLNNIERVEVDEGPQGTLFGRNATGGVIQVVTRDPSHQFGGNMSVGYGSYNTVTSDGYMTGGVTNTLAADFAVYINDRTSGYGTNLNNRESIGNQEELALRSKWLWTPSDLDAVNVILDYERSAGSEYTNNRYVQGTVPFGSPSFASSNPWDVDSQHQPTNEVDQGGVSLTYDHNLGFAKLDSITAYRKTNADALFSFSLYPFDIGANIGQSYDQVSEELHLASSPGSAIKWVAGIYYLDDPAHSSPFNLIGDFLPVIAGAPANPITYNTVTDLTRAVFGQTTIPLPWIMRSDLTLGLRYTKEERGINGNVGLIGVEPSFESFAAHQSFSPLTWRLALDHHFTDSLMAYISDSRGYRAGTYNGSGTSVAALVTPVNPETLDAYEIGVKSEFHRRLTINADGYYYNYRQIQVPIYTATGVTVLNGPHAKIYGADLNAVMAVTSRLKVQGGLALLHSEFLSFPSAPFFSSAPTGGLIGYGASASGKELPVAPKATFDLQASYRIPLNGGDALAISGNYYFKDRWFSGPDNGLAAPSSRLLNAAVSWFLADGRYELQVWGRNLLDEAIVARLSEIAPWGEVETLQPPRTVGASVRVQF